MAASSKASAGSFFRGVGDKGWYKSEIEQMKRIHKCYRDSMRDDLIGLSHPALRSFASTNSLGQASTSSDASTRVSVDVSQATNLNDLAQDPNKKADPEGFLPPDSCLRTVNGEVVAPSNCPFKDYNTFENTLSIDYWKKNFQETGHDRFLGEIAQSLVAHICQSQARKELRVKPATAPIGQFFRVKREHITPLALVLHELKEWAVNRLRVMSIYEQKSYLEIAKRIKYIEALEKKEVWGAEKGVFEQGMKPVAHDALFRLLLATREDLIRAKEYAFRGFSRQRSREKLARLNDQLKNVMFNAMRVSSAVMTLDEKLTDPKCYRLNPTDLLNSSQNQTFVDYSNIANVCLRSLVQQPLVRGVLLAEYDTAKKAAIQEADDEEAAKAAAAAAAAGNNARRPNPDVPPRQFFGFGQFPPGDIRGVIATWRERNLFCVPSNNQSSLSSSGNDGASEPAFLVDEEHAELGIPRIYKENADKIEEDLKDLNKKARTPPKRKAFATAMAKMYNSQSDAPKVLRALMKLLAAIQDLAPVLYAVHEFWGLAGDGGDITLYDTLRSQVIAAMRDAVSRIRAVRAAEHELLLLLGNMSADHGRAMEVRRLKTRKAEYEPAWVTNFNWIMTELIPYTSRSFDEAEALSSEIAKDAWEYKLTKEGLNDKVAQCRGVVEALTGSSSASRFGNQQLQNDFSMNSFIGASASSNSPDPGNWLSGGQSSFASSSASSSSNAFPNRQVFNYDDTDASASSSLLSSNNNYGASYGSSNNNNQEEDDYMASAASSSSNPFASSVSSKPRSDTSKSTSKNPFA